MRSDLRQEERYARQEERHVKQENATNNDAQNKENATNNDAQNKENKEKVKDMMRGFIGKNVSIMLRGKKSLKGRLESVSQYDIIITASHKPVLIMKHAIDYLEPMED